MGGSSGPPVDWTAIGLGIFFGFVGRLLMLRGDYRHYPGYPAGYVTHIALSFLAAVIGAVFYPALAGKQYTAATFLVLAATNFTTVRKAEAKKLSDIDNMTLVKRGPGYIAGIAQAFDERNYLAMLMAVVPSFTTSVFGWGWGILGGLLAFWGSWRVRSGRSIGDVCEVEQASIRFEKESLLYVGDVMLMEVGLPKARERYLKEGIGVVITPKTRRGAGVVWDLGQRQAIAHAASMIVGVKSDFGYPERTPLVRMDLPQGLGRAAMVLIPVAKDPQRVIEAVRRTPVLEDAKAHAVHSQALEVYEQKSGAK